jgi:hypothetical protein
VGQALGSPGKHEPVPLPLVALDVELAVVVGPPVEVDAAVGVDPLVVEPVETVLAAPPVDEAEDVLADPPAEVDPSLLLWVPHAPPRTGTKTARIAIWLRFIWLFKTVRTPRPASSG